MPDNEKGFAMASELPDEVQASLKRMRDNLLICLIKRAGGKVVFPCSEVDAADDMLTMTIEGTNFIIETKRRQ